jgi:esterase/lipase
MEKISLSLTSTLALKLFLTPIRFKETDKQRAIRIQAEEIPLSTRGKKVMAYKWGSGDNKVLLAHGWSGRASQFWKFIEQLSKSDFTVYALDCPAHGQSEGRSTDLIEYAEAIVQLQQLAGGVHFVGHSFGGIAGVFSITLGAKFKSYTSIGSPTFAQFVLEEFCNRIKVSSVVGESLAKKIKKRYGKPLDEASISTMLKEMTPFPYLMIHDIDDTEVPFRHAQKCYEMNAWVQLLKTEGLGHFKILKSSKIIKATVDFALANN